MLALYRWPAIQHESAIYIVDIVAISKTTAGAWRTRVPRGPTEYHAL
jgi:hypothetical protein